MLAPCLGAARRWTRRPPSGPTQQCCSATSPATCRVSGGALQDETEIAETASVLAACCMHGPYSLHPLPGSRIGLSTRPSLTPTRPCPCASLAPPLAAAEATCKKVLLNAFTRALRDGFPPARVAGLKSIVATAQYHTPEDAATRVLPAVAPLCIDAVHEVRASALACVHHFTKVLVEHNAVLDQKAAALQQSEARTGSDGERAAAAGGAAPGSSGGGSLLNSFGWAVSGLGLGRGGAPEAAAATGKPAPAAAASSAAPAAAAAAPPAAAGSAARGMGGLAAAAPAAGSNNGWADDDPLEDMEDDLAAGGWAGVTGRGRAVARACIGA